MVINPSAVKSFFVKNKRRILLGIIIAAALGAIGWQAYQYYQASKKPTEEEIRLNILRGITAPVTPPSEAVQKSVLKTIVPQTPSKNAKTLKTVPLSEDQKLNILNRLAK